MEAETNTGRIGTNLTEGSVSKQLIRFAIPFLLSSVVQSLYNVADIVIVGRFVGSAGIAGVTLGGNIVFLATNFIIGLCSGGTVLIGQFIGAKDDEGLRETVATLITFLIVAAVLVTIPMILLREGIMRLLNTPMESVGYTRDYLSITSLGMVFIFGYNALSGIMRGMGDSKRPMWFVAIACGTNIVLDLVMVGWWRMGSMGAALATVVSQALSMFLCVFTLRRNHFMFDFHPRSFRIHWARLGRIIRIGAPTAAQNVIVSLSFLFIQGIINLLGVHAASGVSVVGRINSFGIMPLFGVSAAVAAMSAQNIGAGKLDRVPQTIRAGLMLSVPIAVVVFSVFQLFPRVLMSAFTPDLEDIQCGIEYIRSFAFDYLIVSVFFVLNGVLMGAGHTTFALIQGIISSVALRAPVSYLLGISMGWGLRGMGFGGPAASLGALCLTLWFYLSGRWKHTTVLRPHGQEG